MKASPPFEAFGIGLVLPSRECSIWGAGDPKILVNAAMDAESSGFDSVWVGESPLARPRPDALVVLAAVAATTQRVTLGTGILLPLLHHPLALAHASATLDRLSGGRLVLGVGPGADVPDTYSELAAFGGNGNRRVHSLLAALDMCRRSWNNQEDVRLSPSPTRPQGPPVWLAAQGERLLKETGRRFNGWLPFSPTPAVYGRSLNSVRENAEEACRNPDSIVPGVFLTISLDKSRQVADSNLDLYMRSYYGLPAALMREVQGCHAGDSGSVAEWLASYVDMGARHLVLRVATSNMEGYRDQAQGVLEAAREALPSPVFMSLNDDQACV